MAPIGEVKLGSLGDDVINFRLGSILLAEMRLMLKDFPSIGGMGVLVALGLFAGGIFYQ